MMNEEAEPFVRRLSCQPLRQIPAGWRDEILAVASDAAVVGRASRAAHPSFRSALKHQLSALLWPHPTAWAGLSAVWLVILAVNISIHDRSPAVATNPAPPAPEVMVKLKQQQRLLAELIGPRDPRDADRVKPLAPRPRTESGRFMAA